MDFFRVKCHELRGVQADARTRVLDAVARAGHQALLHNQHSGQVG